MIRVLVADDHKIVRDGLKRIVASAADIEVAAEAAAASLLQAGDKASHEALSDREFEVLRLLVEGLGPTEIGDKLHLSVKTVSTHKARLLEKLSVANQTELVHYAIKHHLIAEKE